MGRRRRRVGRMNQQTTNCEPPETPETEAETETQPLVNPSPKLIANGGFAV